MQHSSSTSTGTNQMIMAINTTYWHNILISYAVEMLNANPRTAGLVLQYRVGTTGAWTNIASSVYSHSSADRTNGQVDNYTNLTLPAAAEYKPVVQLRWASWRGTQTGNSSGVAVDNVNVSASPIDLPTNVSASTASSCSQLFLSELVSDTTGNFGCEVYNPTDTIINLTGYYLTVSNGTNTPSYYPLVGTISSYSTFVVVNGKSPSAWLRGKANLLNGMSYNYSQVIGLVYSTNPLVSAVMIDAIGDMNGTPTSNGWTVIAMGDTGSTKNHDLVRMPNISGGDLEWSKAQYEWYAHPRGTYGCLDWHNSICRTLDVPIVSFVHNGAVADMCPLTNGNNTDDQTITFSVQLVGQGATWGTPVSVNIGDAGGLTPTQETQVNCSPYGAQATFANGDYTLPFPQANFDIDTLYGLSTQTQPFQVNVIEANTEPDDQIYACFGLLLPGSGNFATNSDNWAVLKITGCLYTGIQSVFNSYNIQAYPNPFGNQIIIENHSQASISDVSLIDILGREILNINPAQQSKVSIDTQSLESGMYFIKVSNNSDNFTVKMLKE